MISQPHIRRRARIKRQLATADNRIIVYRSNTGLYAQVVNKEGKVLAAASSLKMTGSRNHKAVEVAKNLAEALKGKKIANLVYDRNGFAYAGVVKAFADALREQGVKI